MCGSAARTFMCRSAETGSGTARNLSSLAVGASVLTSASAERRCPATDTLLEPSRTTAIRRKRSWFFPTVFRDTAVQVGDMVAEPSWPNLPLFRLAGQDLLTIETLIGNAMLLPIRC